MIRLLGYTKEEPICLIYELGEHGSVADNLASDERAQVFHYKARVRVQTLSLCLFFSFLYGFTALLTKLCVFSLAGSGVCVVDQALTALASVLNYMHRSHSPPVFHRDVKSSNLVLARGMDVKLIDCGLARLLTEARATFCPSLYFPFAYSLPTFCGSFCVTFCAHTHRAKKTLVVACTRSKRWSMQRVPRASLPWQAQWPAAARQDTCVQGYICPLLLITTACTQARAHTHTHTHTHTHNTLQCIQSVSVLFLLWPHYLLFAVPSWWKVWRQV
jgi:hypothetical protein